MPSQQVDLRAIIRDIGGLPPGGALSAVDLRDHAGDVELLEDGPQKISVDDAAAIEGWVDGVQASRPLTWRGQRAVALSWAAAGAAGVEGKPLLSYDRLWLGCSSEDEVFASTIAHGADVLALPTTDPLELSKLLLAQLAEERELLERRVVSDLAGGGPGLIACDGPIVARTRHPRVVGVVKSHATRYMPDHTSLYRLRAGWRSAAFKITGRGGERYSAYVRLHDASERWWDFGMIRLETFEPEVIDPLAAAVLRERQHQGSRDGRWDRHLGTVRWVEDWLRGQRPLVLSN